MEEVLGDHHKSRGDAGTVLSATSGFQYLHFSNLKITPFDVAFRNRFGDGHDRYIDEGARKRIVVRRVQEVSGIIVNREQALNPASIVKVQQVVLRSYDRQDHFFFTLKVCHREFVVLVRGGTGIVGQARISVWVTGVLEYN